MSGSFSSAKWDFQQRLRRSRYTASSKYITGYSSVKVALAVNALTSRLRVTGLMLFQPYADAKTTDCSDFYTTRVI